MRNVIGDRGAARRGALHCTVHGDVATGAGEAEGRGPGVREREKGRENERERERERLMNADHRSL